MNEKLAGAYDENPQFFRYRKEPLWYKAAMAILNFLAFAGFLYALINFFIAGDLGLRNAGLITGTLSLIAIWALNYWNLQKKADKEEMFTVWAIEHHGLTPLEYKLGSTGSQRFTAMETGDEVIRTVSNENSEFEGKDKPKCVRVNLS